MAGAIQSSSIQQHQLPVGWFRAVSVPDGKTANNQSVLAPVEHHCGCTIVSHTPNSESSLRSVSMLRGLSHGRLRNQRFDRFSCLGVACPSRATQSGEKLIVLRPSGPRFLPCSCHSCGDCVLPPASSGIDAATRPKCPHLVSSALKTLGSTSKQLALYDGKRMRRRLTVAH